MGADYVTMPQPNERAVMQAQANAFARRNLHAQSLAMSTAAPLSKDYGSISIPNPNYTVPGGSVTMAIPTTVAQAQTRGWWLVNPTEEELMYGPFTKAMLEHRPVPASFAQHCTDAPDGTALNNALCAALNLP